MAKKKQQDTQTRQKPFQTTPFSNLKGVAVSLPPTREVEPPLPSVAPPVDGDEDAGLFLQAMGGVRRLDAPQRTQKASAEAHKPARAPSPPIRREMIDPAEQEAFNQAIGQLHLDVTFSDRFPEEDELKPMGANRLRQLKKGVIRVDRQIDLHGLTREEALEELPRFLRNARVHGEKAVLVITGKGNNSPGEPVLQQAVAAWLREVGREFVLEFAPAPREMGGSGAFVVFLRV
jgi:DNA-nicking Smr family endonuclease